MEDIKNLLSELKKEDYTKYDIEIRYYIPTLKEKYQDYSTFNVNQKKIFKLFINPNPEKPSNLLVSLRLKKLFSVISEQDFEKSVDFFTKVIDSAVNVDICAIAHLPVEKYVTIPPLPTVLREENRSFGKPVLTGVKINFEEAKKDLKRVGLDVSPCLGCGAVDMKIILFFKKEYEFSSYNIVSILSDAEKYSKFFYKSRDAKQ